MKAVEEAEKKAKEELAEKRETLQKMVKDFKETLDKFLEEANPNKSLDEQGIQKAFKDRITKDEVYGKEIGEMVAAMISLLNVKDLPVYMLVNEKQLPWWFSEELYDDMNKAFKAFLKKEGQ